MNVGEQSAIEAMLHLSYPTLPQPPHPTHRYKSPPRSLPTLPKHPENMSGSSVTPSLSPIQQKRSPRLTTNSESSRPRAMCLSQLLTDDSQPEHINLPSAARLQNPVEMSHALHLPPAPLQQGSTPVMEPLTPPFSPPVLPLLAAFTGLPGVRSDVSQMNDRCAGAVNQWVRAPQLQPGSRMEMDGGRVFTSVGQQQQQQQHQQQYSSGSVGTLVGSSRVGCTDVSTRSTNEAVKKIVKRPYKKFYSNATPSSHCHVCARTSKAVKFAVCARISEGLCRKVTCYKCFAKFGWDWEAAVNNKSWVCVHCRGVCPEGRSQCYIYTRVNSKRESKRGVKKVGKGKGKGKQTDFSGSVSQSNSAVGGLPSISSLEAQGMTSISRHNQHDVGVPGGAVFRMG